MEHNKSNLKQCIEKHQGTELTFDVMLDIEMLIKFAPASVATAFANIVLPVPGGPNNRIPLQG